MLFFFFYIDGKEVFAVTFVCAVTCQNTLCIPQLIFTDIFIIAFFKLAIKLGFYI